jgi:thioesterase domain-containing protein
VLLDAVPEGPYHLGGHCNGGLIAFEMARRLKLLGHEVGLLALIHSQFSGNEPEGLRPKPPPLYQPTPEMMKSPRVRSAWRSNRYRGPILRYRPASYPGKIVLL